MDSDNSEYLAAYRWLSAHAHPRRSTRRGVSIDGLAKRIATSCSAVSHDAVAAAATALGYAIAPPEQGSKARTDKVALGTHQCSLTCRVFRLGTVCVTDRSKTLTPERDYLRRASPEAWEDAGPWHDV